ncbi:hypothetical protein [Streptomyces hirsutus]|uniref:hypothetical protein n=1 Tax=Streptomyces hirsutus TaxID=35620 RepID=UPI00332DE1B4
MFLHLPTYAWALIAAAVTPIHISLMRWSMPTPKAKKNVSFIPLVLGLIMLIHVVSEDNSLSIILYLYSAILMIFVIMIVPVRKRVSADILRQEQNPDIKVQVDKLSMAWITFSLVVTVVTAAVVWVSKA